MKAKPILIVRLSTKCEAGNLEKISKTLKKTNKDYNVIIVYEDFDRTTFEVLNGEFSNKSESI